MEYSKSVFMQFLAFSGELWSFPSIHSSFTNYNRYVTKKLWTVDKRQKSKQRSLPIVTLSTSSRCRRPSQCQSKLSHTERRNVSPKIVTFWTDLNILSAGNPMPIRLCQMPIFQPIMILTLTVHLVMRINRIHSYNLVAVLSQSITNRMTRIWRQKAICPRGLRKSPTTCWTSCYWLCSPWLNSTDSAFHTWISLRSCASSTWFKTTISPARMILFFGYGNS